MAESPFVPGARVAKETGWSGWRGHESYVERYVDKVYKNGNFTLKGDAERQQWRPHGEDPFTPGMFRAVSTSGGPWGRLHCLLWNKVADKEIKATIAGFRRRERLRKVKLRIDALKASDVTDAMLDAIERALPAEEKA